MSDLKTFGDLRAEVERHGYVLTVEMGVLRDLAGYDKLGSNVRAYIRSKLAGVGLKHWSGPELAAELPLYQHDLVRLYIAESDIDLSYRAHVAPGEEGDQFLRQQIAGDESKAILLKIRELLPTLDR